MTAVAAHTTYGVETIPIAVGATPATSLIATCDPVLYGLGQAFQAIARTQLNAAWAEAAVGLHPNVVAEVHYREPGPDLAKREWHPPALFLWRESEKWFQRTQVWDTCESVIRCAYLLPPLTVEFFDRLAPVRVALVRTIRSFLEHKGDATYLSGANVLAALGIEYIWLTEAQYGGYGVSTGDLQVEHPAVRFVLDTREREMPNYDIIVTMTQAETILSSGESGTASVDLVEMKFDPTI